MKPEPRPLRMVCTMCGLDWERHGAKPTAEKCVELLKADLAKRPVWNGTVSGTGITHPVFYGGTVN